MISSPTMSTGDLQREEIRMEKINKFSTLLEAKKQSQKCLFIFIFISFPL